MLTMVINLKFCYSYVMCLLQLCVCYSYVFMCLHVCMCTLVGDWWSQEENIEYKSCYVRVIGKGSLKKYPVCDCGQHKRLKLN